jgi:hypothetical protein
MQKQLLPEWMSPDNSLLNQILEGKQGHLLTFQQRISEAQIRGIRQWVLEGAKNN